MKREGTTLRSLVHSFRRFHALIQETAYTAWTSLMSAERNYCRL
jgi:hypothetical protein